MNFIINCNGEKHKLGLNKLKNHVKLYEFLENYLFVKKFKTLNFIENIEFNFDMFDTKTINSFVEYCIQNVSYMNSLDVEGSFDLVNLHKLSLYLNQPYIIGTRASILPIVIDFNIDLIRNIKKFELYTDVESFYLSFPSIKYFYIPNVMNIASLLSIPYYKNLFINFLNRVFKDINTIDSFKTIKFSDKWGKKGTNFTNIIVSKFKEDKSKFSYEIIFDNNRRL